ncbi:MAG TPA: glycosyltransferase [Alphaproteobacteria bacterium]|nr:glycosyltransferase [Alphaproteobacteria bacterium]
MRIAIFAHEFPSPSETFVLDHAIGLVERGHDVAVFADAPRAGTPLPPEFEAHRLDARSFHPDIPASHGRRVRNAIVPALELGRHRLPLALRSLDAMRHGHDALSLRLLYWSALLARQPPFDLIHCHFGPIGDWVATLREIGAIRGRLVTTFHGVDVSALLGGAPQRYRQLFARGDLFLAVSDHWRARLAALGCDEARLLTQRMGVDLARFRFRARRPEVGAPLRILTVGRLVEKKGVDWALRAVARACGQGVSLRHTIVGDGPMRAALEREALGLGLERVVEFLGWRSRAEVASLMDRHDVILAPSVTSDAGDQEGIPVTLMEAMAAGMIVVSTRHSGIPELVESGITGFLAPERDAASLAHFLCHLADAPAEFERMGLAARGKIEREYDRAKLDRRLEAIYARLLATETNARDEIGLSPRAARDAHAPSGVPSSSE